MKIIRDKVEQTLIETAQVCQKMNVPLRCLYVGLSSSKLGALDTQSVIDVIEGCFKSHEIDSMGYATSDNDLFFLSRQITTKMYEDIIKLFPAHIGVVPLSAVHLFEMQIDAMKIIQICSDKLKKHAEEDQKKEKLRLENQEQARQIIEKNIELDIALNITLLETFEQRRSERRAISVLVVEDDPFSQRLVANALREETVEISVASSGRQALQVMMKTAPDMIFLDIGLPDVTGLEILDEIFQIDPKAHVVMLSGNGSRDNVVGAIQKGARDFIGKPFTVEKLHIAMTKCIFIQDKRMKKGVSHG